MTSVLSMERCARDCKAGGVVFLLPSSSLVMGCSHMFSLPANLRMDENAQVHEL